jgi:glycosyltransferase involved in cell wall biosynthesis
MTTILFPIDNVAEYIDASVTSILSQTFTTWELLIGIYGNNQVYKKVKEYENKDERIHVFNFYKKHIDKAKAKTLNKLVMYAKYNFISFIDVGDIWQTDKLKIQIPLMEIYDVVGSNVSWLQEMEEIEEEMEEEMEEIEEEMKEEMEEMKDMEEIKEMEEDMEEEMKEMKEMKENLFIQIPINDISEYDFSISNPIIHSSAMIRLELAWWDPRLVLNEYDLWIRLRKQNKKMYNYQDCLLVKKYQPNYCVNVESLIDYHFGKI